MTTAVSRTDQEELLASCPSLSLGDVASCNLTMLQGGTQVWQEQEQGQEQEHRYKHKY